MAKVDLKKERDSYRARLGEFRLVDVPPAQYLMVDGHGDPNTSQEYADALSALYPVAYKLKFASKDELDRDAAVAKVARKDPPACLEKVRLETLHEGCRVQPSKLRTILRQPVVPAEGDTSDRPGRPSSERRAR